MSQECKSQAAKKLTRDLSTRRADRWKRDAWDCPSLQHGGAEQWYLNPEPFAACSKPLDSPKGSRAATNTKDFVASSTREGEDLQ